MLLRLLNCQLKPGGFGLVCGAHLLFMTGGEPPGLAWPGGHGELLRRSRGDAAGVKPVVRHEVAGCEWTYQWRFD